ncbi:hypothetical protein [Synechococcus sp. CCY 9618]|uniref:hypothetical protein n=1 Tax=Synechococcus sp. CCY 9618 TaxID=2815602 RepID=UPI001C24A1A5|nr:hypothetical protein [Synechococcus sp. CCY 9618]
MEKAYGRPQVNKNKRIAVRLAPLFVLNRPLAPAEWLRGSPQAVSLEASLMLPLWIGFAAFPALAAGATQESVGLQRARASSLPEVPTGVAVTGQGCETFGPETHFRCHVGWNDPGD